MASMNPNLGIFQVLLELAAKEHGAGVFHITRDLTRPNHLYIIPDKAFSASQRPAHLNIQVLPPKNQGIT